MKIRFESSYWPNAFGFVGFCFAVAIVLQTCSTNLSKVQIEQEKTKQLELQNTKTK